MNRIFFLSKVVFRVQWILILTGWIAVSGPLTFGQSSLSIVIDENAVRVLEGKAGVMRYRYGDAPYKPYMQALCTPGGVNVLRDAPHDHLHHHALMYAIKVDGVNFWEEHQAPGRQRHVRFVDPKIVKDGDRSKAVFTEQVEWEDPKTKKVLLLEERTMAVMREKKMGATVLNWQVKFSLPKAKGSATLTGSHYHGLGMRFLESMDKGGKFFTTEDKKGETVRGTEQLTRSGWCAYTAKANGKPVTVAMFDHPQNVRHPAWWFTMTKPFAYLSATLNMHREPLPVVSGKPLILNYGVVLWDGAVTKERIQKMYEWWGKKSNPQALRTHPAGKKE